MTPPEPNAVPETTDISLISEPATITSAGWLRTLWQTRVRGSRSARQAAWIMVANGMVRLVAFFGSTYAAKCLGPTNLGLAAFVQSFVQPLGVVNGGGMDLTMVRRIATNQAVASPLIARIMLFRVKVLLVVILPLWIGVTLLAVPIAFRPLAWMGCGLVAVTAFGIGPLYQALERLPLQSGITLAGTVFTTLCYLLLFKPGATALQNLEVITGTLFLTTALSWAAVPWITTQSAPPASAIPPVRDLLKESFPFWVQAIVAYFYSTFQLPLIALLMSQRQLGVYRTAIMLTAAAELFFSSINSLLLPKLVQWKAIGVEYLWKRQSEMVLTAAICGGAISLPLIVCAPLIYRFLGPEFAAGVVPFQIFLVARCVVFVGQVYAWSLTALRLDRQYLSSTIIASALSVGANLIVIPLAGLVGAALVNLLTETVVHLFCFWHVRQKVLGDRAAARLAT